MEQVIRCPRCGVDNAATARFCQNCGQKLARVCMVCGTINSGSARFCRQCGSNLGASAWQEDESLQASSGSDERLARLTRTAPLALAQKMRSPEHRAGERRMVTVVFADVVGSTALAEKMDPEDFTALMNAAFAALIPPIYQYEGTIARLMGDALLAFFGAPVAHENDPARAIDAALAILAEAEKFASQARERYGVEFAIRIGVNTGPVVVGKVGSDLVYEYTAMGDAVNLANRLQSEARPMRCLISENSYRLVAPLFEFTDLGEILVKGRSLPVKVFEVVRRRSGPERLRGVGGLASPLVGRARELAALVDLTQALQAGVGRAAVLIGEAGIGKSRLVAEWKKAVESGNQSPAWITGQCLSYGQSSTYHLLVDLLRSLLGIPAGIPEPETGAAANARLYNLLGADAGASGPLVSQLLSLPLAPEAQERLRFLDPQAQPRQLQEGIWRLLLAAAKRRPCVFLLEDIHWADPSSVELLSRLFPLVFEAPILFCCVTRAEPEAPGWKLVDLSRQMFQNGLLEIALNPLTVEESHALLSNLLALEALPVQLRDLIMKKADGNPLFVEEIIRMLIEQKVLVNDRGQWSAHGEYKNLSIPDTLHGLLQARIDRLPEETKHTLRVAAVIGRHFSAKILEQVLSEKGVP